MTTRQAVAAEKLNLGLSKIEVIDAQHVGKGRDKILALVYRATTERSEQIRYAVFHDDDRDRDHSLISGILSTKTYRG